MSSQTPVAVGLRAKTGRCIAVAVREGDDGPVVVLREEIRLWTASQPDSRQPHHAGLGKPPDEALCVVRKAEQAVARVARGALGELLTGLRRARHDVTHIGVVGPPEKDVSRIGNEHVRAHAAEGQLFRHVLEVAARARRIPVSRVSDRSAWDDAARALGCAADALRAQISSAGETVGPPWRADEKLACLAAWCSLVGPKPASIPGRKV